MCAVADDFMVARWMTRAFPHPYTLRDADEWISIATSGPRGRYYAIEVDGVLAGGIGVEPYRGERSGTAAFGYWLGRAYWGRGIGTDAARTLSDQALSQGRLRRLEARVFAPNVASARVLEKCGFALEGRLHGFYVDREDKVCDALTYGRLATSEA
jgi:[ribosomal protein S5]-alanine N-acetyltransferase